MQVGAGVYVGVAGEQFGDVALGVLLVCQVVGDVDLPVGEGLVECLDPQTDAAFAGVDFLAAADEADDGCPVFVLVEGPDEEFAFGHGEVGNPLLPGQPGAQVAHVPHALRFVEDGDVLHFGGVLLGGFGYFVRVDFDFRVQNRRLQLGEHVVAVAVDDLDEAAHLPFGLGLGAADAFGLFFGDFIACKRFGEDFHQRTVAGEVDGKVALLLLDGDVQADERFSGARNARHEADALLFLLFGFVDDVQDELSAAVDAGFVRFVLGDVLYAVVHVEGGGCLDDRGRGRIAAEDPVLWVNGLACRFFLQDLLQKRKKGAGIGEQRLVDFVVVVAELQLVMGLLGLGGNEDRDDREVRAFFVEVL